MAQHDSRRYIDLFDQHERKWGAVIEIRTGHRIGPPTPIGWKSPMLPPDKYLVHSKESPFRITVSYDAWARDSKNAFAMYEERRRQAAMKISAQGTVSQVLRDNPPELVDIVGPPPSIAPVVAIQAAKAGNKWVLYGEGKPPEAALKLDYFARFRDDYTEDRSWRSRLTDIITLPSIDPFASSNSARRADKETATK